MPVKNPPFPNATAAASGAEVRQMWMNHSSAARAFALTITHRYDPDDLVSEAFTRILQRINAGHSVDRGFKSYLFTTIRNIAVDWSRTDREIATDTLPEVPDVRTPESIVVKMEPNADIARAFAGLPDRWQRALWLTEVERMKPKQVAGLMGMSPGAVAQMTFRARGQLRTQWIGLQIDTKTTGDDCAEALSAWESGDPACADEWQGHTAVCADCEDFVARFKELPKTRG